MSTDDLLLMLLLLLLLLVVVVLLLLLSLQLLFLPMLSLLLLLQSLRSSPIWLLTEIRFFFPRPHVLGYVPDPQRAVAHSSINQALTRNEP